MGAYVETPIQKRTHVAGGDIVADTFVKTAAAVVHCGAGEAAIGVAKADASLGQLVPVDVLGDTLVLAGAAVAADAYVEADADGKAITRTTGVTLGRALTAATAEDQRILIQIKPVSQVDAVT